MQAIVMMLVVVVMVMVVVNSDNDGTQIKNLMLTIMNSIFFF